MATPAIKVEDVSKRYLLGAGVQGSSQSAAVAIDRMMRRAFRLKLPERERREEFWALRDVSLEVEHGQAYGLIGANGAGKSTLLKLLARITFPTKGRITLQGRLGSLLEVGTGFHPELTGRENVFLNGTILGMKRTEVMARYQEITDFAGIDRFLETPVKRYSSGMFVRLAFSVAAHLRPDILLVDEVLAVGDAEFQRKCMEMMKDITDSGDTTIVFVTHNTPWVRKICDRAAFIDNGRIEIEGPAAKVVDEYLDWVQPVEHGGTLVVPPDVHRSGTGEAQIEEVSLTDDEGKPMERVGFGQPFNVRVKFDVKERIPEAMVAIGIAGIDGGRILTNYSTDRGRPLLSLEPGPLEVKVRVETTLLPGEFILAAGIGDAEGRDIDFIERLLSFTALALPADDRDDRFPWESGQGYVRPDADWTIAAGSDVSPAVVARSPQATAT